MSSVFRLGVHLRRQLYKSGVLQTQRLNYPVISIGNLTLGGTGKTPLTIFLAEELSKRGFRPVILSRGYGRTTRGCVVVSRGEGPLISWEKAGDEPYLMAQRLAGRAAVVVGESRYLAGQLAEREKVGNLYILDDGFQHIQLHRDFDIVTVDSEEWVAGEKLLPLGRWREPKSAIARAHAACVSGRSIPDLPIPQFTMRIKVVPGQLEALKGKSITAFAGVAKPERFFSTLESAGLRLRRKLCFADHHQYSEEEVKQLEDEAVVTTEKDAVKLGEGSNFVALRISAEIVNYEKLEQVVLERIRLSKINSR